LRIKYIEHKDLDFQKWNKCISSSINGTIHAYSWFLELTCDYWDALIEDDYASVMPLPIYKKGKYEIISQHYFQKSLGLYSGSTMRTGLLKLFMDAIPKKFKYYKITVNKFVSINGCENLHDGYYQSFELDLISNYDKLKSHYQEFTCDAIASSKNLQVSVVQGLQPYDLLQLMKKNKNLSSAALREKDIQVLRLIISQSIRNGMGEIVGAYDVYNNLTAAVLFFNSYQKIYLTFYAQSKDSLGNKALYAIVDHYIKKNAEKNLTLTFETDSKKSPLSASGFGAMKSFSPVLKYNRIPSLIKLINRIE